MPSSPTGCFRRTSPAPDIDSVSVFAVPDRCSPIQVQARIIAHQTEYIGLLERFQLLRRLNGNEGRVALIVALVPVDPFVPFMEIQLAAFPALVQRAREMAAVLGRIPPPRRFPRICRLPAPDAPTGRIRPEGAIAQTRSALLPSLYPRHLVHDVRIISRAGLRRNPGRCEIHCVLVLASAILFSFSEPEAGRRAGLLQEQHGGGAHPRPPSNSGGDGARQITCS